MNKYDEETIARAKAAFLDAFAEEAVDNLCRSWYSHKERRNRAFTEGEKAASLVLQPPEPEIVPEVLKVSHFKRVEEETHEALRWPWDGSKK